MRRLFCVVMVAGLATGVGCKRVSKNARLVSDQELAKMQSDHAARLATHMGKSCMRPVLRGTAAAGDGTGQVLAFADAAKGPHAGCLGALSSLDDISALLLVCDKGMDPRQCPARALADEPKKAEIDGVLAKCGDTMGALQTATSHDAVCSPFRVSKGPKDPVLLGYIRAGQVAAFQTRTLAREGKHAAAIDLALDAARLAQDVSRPGANLITAMITVASMRAPLAAAESVLNAKLPWTAAEVDAAAKQADTLRASQIPWGDTMVGEGLFMLEELARQLRGDVKVKREGDDMGLHPNDEHGVAWIALRANSAASEKVCVGTSLKACVEGSDKLQADGGKDVEKEVAKELGSNPDKLRAQIRKRIVAILREVAGASMSKYVKRHVELEGRLAGLRAHVEYVRLTVADKKCPDAKAATDAMAPLLASKTIGDPLTTFVAPDGTIEVRLPEWAVYNDKKTPNPERLTVWRIRCPS